MTVVCSGLLAGMWELPSSTLTDSNDSKVAERTQSALTYVKSLLNSDDDCIHSGEIGIVPWLFSHLKLTMYVHLFQINSKGISKGRWASKDQVEDESMGTGMRKCWSLVKDL